MKRPVIWLLSAYHADSHASWAHWLSTNLDGFTWHTVTLPGRHFRWRIRGNPLSWLDRLPPGTPDLILATSMVDLATLIGLNPRLANVPKLYYFHENQFAYPASDDQHPSIDPQMVQLYGALAAERVLFNSAFNRDSFLAGVERLLQRLPDQVPPGIVQRLRERSKVLPVPIQPIRPQPRQPGLILWPHRWEYDKAPEVFLQAVARLHATGLPFHLALLGARTHPPHPALLQLRNHFAAHIAIDAYLEPADYRGWVARADIAVSTAIHEFQGLAMLEAASAGATPLVPDALCYPEQYPPGCRYAAGDAEALATALADWLQGTRPRPAVDVSAWYGEALQQRWRQVLGSLLN